MAATAARHTPHRFVTVSLAALVLGACGSASEAGFHRHPMFPARIVEATPALVDLGSLVDRALPGLPLCRFGTISHQPPPTFVDISCDGHPWFSREGGGQVWNGVPIGGSDTAPGRVVCRQNPNGAIGCYFNRGSVQVDSYAPQENVALTRLRKIAQALATLTNNQ
jgi:hypothetical protein